MLFVTQTAEAITSAMRAARIAGRIAVIEEPRLARALRERGSDVVAIGSKLRALKKSAGPRVCADSGALPIAPGAFAGLVAVGIADNDEWEPVIAGYADAVEDGGLVVFVDRSSPPELSRRALCGGLAAIEQRQAGRTIITSGRVVKLRSRPSGSQDPERSES